MNGKRTGANHFLARGRSLLHSADWKPQSSMASSLWDALPQVWTLHNLLIPQTTGFLTKTLQSWFSVSWVYGGLCLSLSCQWNILPPLKLPLAGLWRTGADTGWFWTSMARGFGEEIDLLACCFHASSIGRRCLPVTTTDDVVRCEARRISDEGIRYRQRPSSLVFAAPLTRYEAINITMLWRLPYCEKFRIFFLRQTIIRRKKS